MTKWTKETTAPVERKWEEFYRNRFQHEKRVRTTHGVNCTGSCSWEVFVKDGIVTWELQATDYPALEDGLPPYEPRGCQRGISFSWYLYSPIRVKYPYTRGALLDLWREARKEHADPVEPVLKPGVNRRMYTSPLTGITAGLSLSWAPI
ncbi:MAG: respiratory nitrate reductase, alpha subunit [Chloroflexi bacterium]|nr:respiratory nitrate reductase, alpha subunit [Chloroflexota bacterium]